MKNLAGVAEADETIREELYLAGLEPIKVEPSKGEVPYTYIGKVGNWKLVRAWRYWMASTDNRGDGFPLEVAMELHNRKSPVNENRNIGYTVRCGGHAGSPSPDEFGAFPIYEEKLVDRLKELNVDINSINMVQITNLFEKGNLKVKSFVDSYHIDDQIGLNEFVKTVKNLTNE